MRILFQDLRYAARQLRQSPAFAFLVILTMALGIGANTAIFSLVNGFLRPLPARAPDRIVVIAARTKGDETGFRYRFSYPALQDLRRQADRFSDIFAYNVGLGGLYANGKLSQFFYSAVTGNFFSGLGLQPAAGRLFLPGEGERSGAESVVVLGYAYWQKRFGGAADVVGRQVRVDGRSSCIVGVAPQGFHGAFGGAEMDGYLLLDHLTAVEGWSTDVAGFFTSRTVRMLTVMGRLMPGVSLDDAQSSMSVIARRMADQYPEAEKNIGIRVVPEPLARPMPLSFLATAIPIVRNFLLFLAALVLLLACLNIANLLLVRATIRQREMAIRAALGSGRGRLIRQMLTESTVLALLGAIAGLLVGKWASDAFLGTIDLSTDFPFNLDFSFDWRVFTYALAAAVLSGLFIGIVPALRAAHAEAGAVLHDGGRAGSGGPGRQRLRSFLIAAQVAGSLVLLIVAGLFVRSLRNAEHLNLGFETDHLLNVRMAPVWMGFNPARTESFSRELLRRVKELPGVESASFAYSVPMGYYSDGYYFYPEGRTLAPGEQPPGIACNRVGPGYFETLRIPILRGRGFNDADTAVAPRVAIVNQTMAARYWPHQDPIGKRFRIGTPDSAPWEIVGVARDSKYLVVFERHLPYFYLPLAQQYISVRTLQVRTSEPPENLLLSVQRRIQSLEPEMPIGDLQTMKQALAGGMGFLMFRVGAMQALALGLLGLVLAVVGIYGVVSYSAGQRTREIGIRMALGAYPRDILRLVLRQGVLLVIVGIAAGIVGAAVLTRVVGRFLILATKTDPLTFVSVTLLLAAVALAACYLPARRAARVDPMAALRHE